MSSGIEIRYAGADDCAVVSEILEEAVTWLESRGMPLWTMSETSQDTISGDVGAGRYVLAEWEGAAVGTLRFQFDDAVSWPDVPSGESTYVHRLAVRRRFAGGIVSTALLRWAVDETTCLGRRYLRLDCAFDRRKLRAIYERFGFTYHSERQVGPYLIARYEYLCNRKSASRV
jgi:acetyltransferase (GNAT) family protein